MCSTTKNETILHIRKKFVSGGGKIRQGETQKELETRLKVKYHNRHPVF
jgi:hypothetical protein